MKNEKMSRRKKKLFNFFSKLCLKHNWLPFPSLFTEKFKGNVFERDLPYILIGHRCREVKISLYQFPIMRRHAKIHKSVN